MSTEITREDRFVGSLVGLAVGDAVGTTVEFEERGTFPEVTDMRGGGPFRLDPGQWTDDTSQALCLGESLIEKKHFEPHHVMEKFIAWWKTGYLSSRKGRCFDIGITTVHAFLRYKPDESPYCGSTDPNSSGNGSLMRLAPVPLFYANDPIGAMEVSKLSSQLSHASDLCIQSCQYYSGLIIGALNGESKETLLSPFYSPIPTFKTDYSLDPKVAEVAVGEYKHKTEAQIVGSGYVVKAMEAALWAFYNSNTFDEGLLKVVNLGDDADTTGAIYGQLAGAYYGVQGIRESWRKKITLSAEIHEMGRTLFKLSQAQVPK
eukprot:TRINITY_DN771_c0_g1_i1.p1 TRINITY_DN771_c0_g1~~TRINITY_DN771_c0_g1_i1.p1  ORF type:complete len:327 (-),score=68.05 TRINITY_DN771_c0_g1_i1:45-998(-)